MPPRFSDGQRTSTTTQHSTSIVELSALAGSFLASGQARFTSSSSECCNETFKIQGVHQERPRCFLPLATFQRARPDSVCRHTIHMPRLSTSASSSCSMALNCSVVPKSIASLPRLVLTILVMACTGCLAKLGTCFTKKGLDRAERSRPVTACVHLLVCLVRL